MNTPLIWYSDYLFRACLPIWIRIMRSHSKVAIFEQSNNVSSRSTTTGGLSKIDAHFVELVELQGILEHMWIGHYSYWNSTLQGTQHTWNSEQSIIKERCFSFKNHLTTSHQSKSSLPNPSKWSFTGWPYKFWLYFDMLEELSYLFVFKKILHILLFQSKLVDFPLVQKLGL